MTKNLVKKVCFIIWLPGVIVSGIISSDVCLTNDYNPYEIILNTLDASVLLVTITIYTIIIFKIHQQRKSIKSNINKIEATQRIIHTIFDCNM